MSGSNNYNFALLRVEVSERDYDESLFFPTMSFDLRFPEKYHVRIPEIPSNITFDPSSVELFKGLRKNVNRFACCNFVFMQSSKPRPNLYISICRNILFF